MVHYCPLLVSGYWLLVTAEVDGGDGVGGGERFSLSLTQNPSLQSLHGPARLPQTHSATTATRSMPNFGSRSIILKPRETTGS